MRNLPAAVALLALIANAAIAQNYPDKPVTMIAPFTAGGSVDLVARAVAQQMSELWKQPVVVTNRPGAGGNIGAEAVAPAAPDGYTLLMGTTALASSPALYSKLGYDLMRDLAPVSLVVTMSNVLVVHPALPVHSVRELVPTINEAGVAGYEATSWNALLAPGNTPRDMVLKIHATLVESLHAARVSAILASAGADAAGSAPDALAGFLRAEMVKWGNVVKTAGVKPE